MDIPLAWKTLSPTDYSTEVSDTIQLQFWRTRPLYSENSPYVWEKKKSLAADHVQFYLSHTQTQLYEHHRFGAQVA